MELIKELMAVERSKERTGNTTEEIEIYQEGLLEIYF